MKHFNPYSANYKFFVMNDIDSCGIDFLEMFDNRIFCLSVRDLLYITLNSEFGYFRTR